MNSFLPGMDGDDTCAVSVPVGIPIVRRVLLSSSLTSTFAVVIYTMVGTCFYIGIIHYCTNSCSFKKSPTSGCTLCQRSPLYSKTAFTCSIVSNISLSLKRKTTLLKLSGWLLYVNDNIFYDLMIFSTLFKGMPVILAISCNDTPLLCIVRIIVFRSWFFPLSSPRSSASISSVI